MGVRGWFLVVLLLHSPVLLAAQQGILAGVVHDSGGAPLPGVEVLVQGSGRQTTTDKAGQFVLTGLPFGPMTVLIRSVGFRPIERGVILLKGDTARLDLTLTAESAQTLPAITTKARRDPPRGMGIRESFEERRKLGFGKFIDSTVLRRNEHRRMVDLLRGIPGITFVWAPIPDCPPGDLKRCPRELYARGTRTGRISGGCFATIIEDGMMIYRSDGGLGYPPDWSREFYINDYEAVEVYRSAAEMPIEFNGSSSQCGVIVLWTRRGH